MPNKALLASGLRAKCSHTPQYAPLSPTATSLKIALVMQFLKIEKVIRVWIAFFI